MRSATSSTVPPSVRDVVPRAQAGVDLRVIDRVEPGVGAVDRIEERQEVHAAEDAGEPAGEQGREVAKPTGCQPVDVGDQLHLVLHAMDSKRALTGGAPRGL